MNTKAGGESYQAAIEESASNVRAWAQRVQVIKAASFDDMCIIRPPHCNCKFVVLFDVRDRG